MQLQNVVYKVSYTYIGENKEIITEERCFSSDEISAKNYLEKLTNNGQSYLYVYFSRVELYHS